MFAPPADLDPRSIKDADGKNNAPETCALAPSTSFQGQISQQSGLGGSRRTILSEMDTSVVRPTNAAWGNKVEFMLTCISYAVGLGNVWRFPYLCYKNGGGAFLVPYCVMLFVLGIPLFLLENSFGQFPSLGPLMVWHINPFFKGLGYAMVAVSFMIPLYYNVIIAQCALFFFMSIRDVLPWASCGNHWNTPECTEPHHSKNGSETASDDKFPVTLNTNYTAAGTYVIVGTKTEEFYYNFILNQSPNGIDDMGLPHWPLALCLLFSWTVVALGLIKGVKSLGKISYFTALFPYVMLTILLIRSCFLPGAINGISFYLKPNWQTLLNIVVWQEAATQIFYSLGCSTGGLLTMASFNKFKNNCLRDAWLVPVLNSITSIFAGFVVFSILGFMAYTKNTTVDKVASGGPGLVFLVYPEALAKLPISPLWSCLFFLMMLTLGFGSVLSLVENVLTAFQDEWHDVINTKPKKIIYRIVVCIICFFLGLPFVCRGGIYLLQLVDFFIAFVALLVIAFLELVALAWIYGYPKFLFLDDMKMMLGREPPAYFRYMWRFISPLVLFILFIASIILYSTPSMNIAEVKVAFPAWAIAIGWIVATMPIAIVTAWMAYYHCYLGGFELMQEHMRPMVNWGPRSQEDRTGRYANQTEAILALQNMSLAQLAPIKE